MKYEYVKEEQLIEKTEIEQDRELIKNIIETRKELKKNSINFEHASEEMVDYYIYQIKAIQSKLDYLIRLAKIKGIQLDIISEKKYELWMGEEAG